MKTEKEIKKLKKKIEKFVNFPSPDDKIFRDMLDELIELSGKLVLEN